MPEHTEEDFYEWVRYVCGCRGDILSANPLADCELLDYTDPDSFREG